MPIAVNGGQTPKPQTPKPDPLVSLSDRLSKALQEAWFERIIDQLLDAEKGERNSHWRADYQQSRIIVALCRAGDPDPLLTSSFRMYGVHPELVFVAIQSIRKAKLGEEYSNCYDENGNLIPQRLDIPDHDPTSPLRRRRAVVAPVPVWPAVRRLAPLRLVVSREPVHGEGGRFLYPNEQLECGHVHVEFFGAAR